jgi:hypothetical protein
VRITKKYKSLRNKPLNLTPKDNFLFKHEYEKVIDKTYLKFKKNIYVDDLKLKKFRTFRVHYIHWRMNDQPISKKTRFFIQDLISFIKNRENQEIIEIASASWVIDVRSNQFFHWISDVFQRIEMLGSLVDEYPVLIPENLIENDYIEETLKLLKVPYIAYNENNLLKIRNLCITSHGAPSGNYNEILFNSAREKILKNTSTSKNNSPMIWISRQNSNKRKIANFRQIEKIITKYGFKIVDFDTLKFHEQLRISKNAEVVAGIHGAGLSHMFFSKKIKKLIEIRAEDDSKNNCFFSMSSALNISYYYFTSAANGNPYDSDYEIDVNKLDIFLSELFNQN